MLTERERVHTGCMASLKLDDPAVLAAMRDYLAAVDALADAVDEKDVLRLGEAKSLAGLTLRKRLATSNVAREDSNR